MSNLFRLALRNLLRHRRRTLLVLAAIAVGVTAVVGVRGFLNGLQSTLIGGFTEGTIGAIQIHRAGFVQSLEVAPLEPNLELTDALARTIEGVEGVRAWAPRISFPGMVNAGDETVFAMMTAVDPVRELQTCPRRNDFLVTGTWLPAGGALPPSLMGMELSKSLHAPAGARAAILAGDADGVLNAVDTTVGATLAAPTQGEKKLVLLSLATGQELVRMPGRATEIAVGVTDIDRVDDVAARLRAALGPDYDVMTWKQIAAFAQDVVATQNAALRVLTLIFLFVILMGVANALLTSVLERVREIGTMMAIGAKRWQILVMFVLEAAFLGVVGGVCGAGLGTGIVAALAVKGVNLTTPGSSLPQHIEPFIHVSFLLQMVLLCCVGAATASLWPAWRASRLRPVEALSR